jgi:hypothetical protein
MIVAIVAIVFALTGSAFAARTLLTGKDIQDGSITKADLAPTAVASAKGKRGPRGPRGHTGPAGKQGEQGPQGDPGLIGIQGERGPQGAVGPDGPAGTVGSTGAKGAKGDKGDTGDPGLDGAPGPVGQAIAGNQVGTADLTGVPLAITSTGPTDSSTEGADVSNGGVTLTAGVQYLVHVSVSFVDPAAADAADLEYGVGRLFLSGSPLDGVTGDPNGGFADGDTTVVTADIPDDTNNAAQASGTFLVTAGGGDEQLTLQAAVRGDELDGANATGHLIVTRIG